MPGVKSTRLVRRRLETVGPMGSGTRGVLEIHSEISDFSFLLVRAMFSSFFEHEFLFTSRSALCSMHFDRTLWSLATQIFGGESKS